MLPAPITLDRSRRQLQKYGRGRHTTALSLLLVRSRLTNLAVIALIGFASLSFLLNLRLYFASPFRSLHTTDRQRPPGHEPWRHLFPTGGIHPPFHGPDGGPDHHVQHITRPEYARNLTHLIMVPGHGIWKGTRPELRMDDDEWVLEPYQRGKGRVKAFFSHIVRGAELALKDPESLVVFSGGQTRESSTLTEADSYLRLALLSNVFHNQPSPTTGSGGDWDSALTAAVDAVPFARATTEQYAMDSYQNLLFSLARFQEFTGHPPSKITVVGYEMKRQRFVSLHRKALRWPEDRFTYVGVGLDPKDDPEAWEGEKANALQPYEHDLYGCHAPLLSKRLSRNPFSRVHPYGRIVLDKVPTTTQLVQQPGDGHRGPPGRGGWMEMPEAERAQAAEQGMVGRLIDWCPRVKEDWTKVYDGPLPWEHMPDA